jgi:hypothetical protein
MESDRAGYIEAYALYLIDAGECPRRSDYGLTFEEGLKCERPALDRAYELETEPSAALIQEEPDE